MNTHIIIQHVVFKNLRAGGSIDSVAVLANPVGITHRGGVADGHSGQALA